MKTLSTRRGCAIAVAVLTLGTACSSDDSPSPSTTVEPPATLTTEAVVRGDLVERERHLGAVAAASIEQLPAGLAGIVTSLPDPGTVLAPGDIAFRIDDRPVVVVAAASPFFRDLAQGDRGADVEQLQGILRDFGSFDLAVDGKFGGETRAAWTAFMADMGVLDVKSMTVGTLRAVTQPEPWLVGAVDLRLGFPVADGEQALTLIGPGRIVELELQDPIPAGSTVTTTAYGDLGQPTTRLTTTGAILYQWSLPDGSDLAVNERIPLTIETATATDVLTVPVAALHQGATGEFFVRCGQDPALLDRCDVTVDSVAGLRAVVTGPDLSEGVLVAVS